MTTKETLDATEKALDAIEVQLDTIEKISAVRMFFRKPSVIIGGTVLISAAAGFAAGYFAAKAKLEDQFAEAMEREIAEAKAFYGTLNKADYPTPGDAVAALHPDEPNVSLIPPAKKALTNYQGKFNKNEDPTIEEDMAQRESMAIAEELDVVEETTEVDVVVDIFSSNAPIPDQDFNYDEEMAKRTDEAPYVISHDEYFEGEKEYAQQTLTYFNGDGVLADEGDAVVDAIESTVGHDNLARFGHGSRDENIVYIRNDRMLIDMEVHRSSGSFSEEVLGVTQNSLEHSHKPRVRKMRHDE